MLRSSFKHSGHVVGKAKLLEGLCNVITGNGLFGLLFGNFVGLGRNEGDEFHAAFNQEISGLFCESYSPVWWQDFTYNLLDGGCRQVLASAPFRGSEWAAMNRIPLGRDRSSLAINHLVRTFGADGETKKCSVY